ncbi:MAG TPA: glycosyltransferase family 39 protein [Chromatiales bacterium]|nr:glycosyltransferase family 39 protein [Chromatiales bacterium]
MTVPRRTAFRGPDWTAWVALALAVELILPAARLPLAPDEAYYWYWAQYPAAGYFDHPPMVAWIIAVTTGLGGDHEFWVRAGALACFAGTLVLLFATLRRLFPELPRQAAWLVVLGANLSLLFPGTGLVMTVDSPLVLFWALALYAGARVLVEGDGRFWWLFGAALGAAMLSKYTAVLLVPCILGFVLVTPAQRRWLTHRDPWIGALLALALFSPVVYWNWRHHWISFAFQLSHGFRAESQPVTERLLEYLGLQLGIVSPGLWLLLAGYGAAGLWLALRQRDARLGYLFALSWPVILFFAWTTAVGDRAEGNWPAPGYLGALVLAVAAWYRGGYHLRRAHRAVGGTLVGLSLAVTLALRVHMLHPVLPVPPGDDPLREFASWPTIGQAVRKALTQADDRASPGRFLVSDRGTRLAEAVFYSGIHGIDLTRPERYLFLGDWRGRFAGRDAVLILNAWTDPDQYRCLFRRMVPTAIEFVPEYRGRPLEEYRSRLYLGSGFFGGGVFPCEPGATSGRGALPTRSRGSGTGS